MFVFSDQQSFDMLGCYGNRQIITPHLDALAAEGVRFNHCVSSQPVCTPFRGMLLTGQHPLRSGAFKNDVRIVPGQGHYFGEVLRDAGYRLGYFGKWHLYGGDRNRPIPPGPYRYGFDHEFLSNNCTLLFDAQHAYYWDDQRPETALRRLGALRADAAGRAVHRGERGPAVRAVPLLSSAAQLAGGARRLRGAAGPAQAVRSGPAHAAAQRQGHAPAPPDVPGLHGHVYGRGSRRSAS